MPLILAKDQYQKWLAGDEGLLATAPPVAMLAHPVSMAVNQAANDSPVLLERVELARGLFD
jgi:putative SOS response-associated peptidase YedK